MHFRQLDASAGVQLCTMLFGLSAVLAKGLDIPASTIVAGRAAWAALTLSIVLLVLKRRLWVALTWRDLFHLSVNGVLLAGHWICFFTGVELGGVAVGTLGFACFPIFVSLIGWIFFQTPVSSRDIISMTLVVVGLLIISPSSLPSEENSMALLWAVAAGLSYAVIVLYNRHAGTVASPIQSSWLQCISCTIVVLPWGYPALTVMNASDFMHVMLIGVLCTGIAYSMLTFALKKIDAGKAAMIISLEPVWAIIFAAIWFGSFPGFKILGGGGLIIAAVLFSTLPRSGKLSTSATN